MRVVIGYDDNGKPKTKNVTAKTKAACQEKLDALKQQVGIVTGKAAPDMPFGEWMELWYKTYSKPHIRLTTQLCYYGNIHPYEREVKKDSEIDRLAKLVLRHDAELRKTLNESETELFGKLKDAWSELTCLNECENSIIGFRLGIRLMAEALQAE